MGVGGSMVGVGVSVGVGVGTGVSVGVGVGVGTGVGGATVAVEVGVGVGRRASDSVATPESLAQPRALAKRAIVRDTIAAVRRRLMESTHLVSCLRS